MENKSKTKPSNEKSAKSNKSEKQNLLQEQNDDDLMTLEQENQFKEKILQLQKELEIEKEKVQARQIDPSVIESLKNEIIAKNKEIKKYANINTKQREQLEQLSQEIDNKLSKMNLKAVTRNIQLEAKKINYLSSGGMNSNIHIYNSTKNINEEQNTIDNNISAKERQLKNIMSLIEILKKENEDLKAKIENAKNTEQKFKLIGDKKEQEKQLNLLNLDIKKKKVELKEHSRCFAIKEDLIKKISIIKEEIIIAHEKLADMQKKYDELENKIKLEKENLLNPQGSKPYKLGNKTKNKFPKFSVKQKPSKITPEENVVEVPPKIGEIFTEKELNAMFIALDKNRAKYDALLKRFNVQNIYVDSLEARHKLNIKQKLDKINHLDEQIEFMNVKKGEYNANIQIYKKQIIAAQEEKKNYKLKIDSLTEEIAKKNRINSRKENEINLLKAQLTKFKKYLKNGEFDKINNEPDIEIKGDEDSSYITGTNEGRPDSTAKTEFYENKENNINNIKVNNDITNDKSDNEEEEEGNEEQEGNNIVFVNDEGTNTNE